MPSHYVHEQVALLALRAQDSPMRGAITLGAYGPDALYYLSPLSSGRPGGLGQRLHGERTGEFLCDLIAACAPDESTRAYACGFLTHYAADAAFHPMVYALSMTQLGYSGIRHVAVERALDAWLTGLGGSGARVLPDERERGALARGFCLALAGWAPDVALTPTDMAQAMKRCQGMGGALGLLGELPATVRLSGVRGDVQLSPDELQSFALRGWVHPWTGLVSHDGPFELMSAAIERAGVITQAAGAYWRREIGMGELRGIIGDMSYLSGIDWRRTRRIEPIETGRIRAVREAFRRGR